MLFISFNVDCTYILIFVKLFISFTIGNRVRKKDPKRRVDQSFNEAVRFGGFKRVAERFEGKSQNAPGLIVKFQWFIRIIGPLCYGEPEPNVV